MKKLISLTAVLALFALLAIGCCNNSITPDNPPDDPPPPPPTTTPQRYLTLWGTDGQSGITITETAYQGTYNAEKIEYENITREQVQVYFDLSDETLFPIDAEYYFWTISNDDTNQPLHITKWADGTMSYSLEPFGSSDNYTKSDHTTIETGPTEKIERLIYDVQYWESDLNRSDYEDNPTGENGEFKLSNGSSQSSNGQYL